MGENLTKNPEVFNSKNKKPSLTAEFRALEEKFNEMYAWYQEQQAAPQELTIDATNFSDEIDARTFKVRQNVLQDFVKFCKKNKQYSQIDILSQALSEFMDKYK